jgi:hypothetical protein
LKILIVLRYAQRLQWLRVKTKAKRAKAPVVRKQTGSSRPATRKTAARDKIRLLIADDHALILEGLAASVFDSSISGQSAEEYLLNFKQLIEQEPYLRSRWQAQPVSTS